MPVIHSRRLVRLAPSLLLVLLLALASASLGKQALAWWRLNQQAAPGHTAEQDDSGHGEPNLAAIESLFGVPAQATSAPRKTSMSLRLLGSFVNVDPSRSSAIIQSGSGQPKRYRAGDNLTNSVTLHAIYRDRVELQSGARLENLFFPENKAIQRVIPVEEPPSIEEDPGGTGAEDDVDVDIDPEGLRLLKPNAPKPTP